jgi:hypothetical protein
MDIMYKDSLLANAHTTEEINMGGTCLTRASVSTLPTTTDRLPFPHKLAKTS